MKTTPADFHARCPACHLVTHVREVDGVWRFVDHGCAVETVDAGPLAHAWATGVLDAARWYATHADAHVAFLEKTLHDTRAGLQTEARRKLHDAEDLAAVVEDTIPRPPKDPFQ